MTLQTCEHDRVLTPKLICLLKDWQGWQGQSVHEYLTRQSHAELLVWEEGDAILGGCLIHRIKEEGEILYLSVKEPFRKKGYGSRILKRLFSLHAMTLWHLEVSCHNRAAYRLYEKHGFIQVGLRRNYYGIQDDAHVMQRTSL